MTAPRVRTLTVSAREFYAFVDRVVHYALDDGDYIPVLNAVQLRTTNGWLVATATDRFRVGLVRAKPGFGVTRYSSPGSHAPDDVPAWPRNFTEVLPLAAYKALRRIVRPLKHLDAELVFTFTDDQIQVAASGNMLHLNDITMTLPGAGAEKYPAVHKVILEAVQADGVNTEFGVNAQYLADFAKTIGRHQALAVRTGRGVGKPLLVAGGEDFIGLLMPRKLSESDGGFPDVSDWVPLLEEEKS